MWRSSLGVACKSSIDFLAIGGLGEMGGGAWRITENEREGQFYTAFFLGSLDF